MCMIDKEVECPSNMVCTICPVVSQKKISRYQSKQCIKEFLCVSAQYITVFLVGTYFCKWAICNEVYLKGMIENFFKC